MLFFNDLMIDNLIKNDVEKEYLLNSIKTIDSIQNISDIAFKFIESDIDISLKITSFVCIEGILFSGVFAIIYWIKNFI